MEKVVDINFAVERAAYALLVPVAGFFLPYLFLSNFLGESTKTVGVALAILTLLIPFKVFAALSKGMVLIESDAIEVPASNTEMSIMDFITLNALRQFMKREVISLQEIHGLTNHRKTSSEILDKGKSKTTWFLIISGDFGSRQLGFSLKQKRDEARAFIVHSMKKIGANAKEDINMDSDEA